MITQSFPHTHTGDPEKTHPYLALHQFSRTYTGDPLSHTPHRRGPRSLYTHEEIPQGFPIRMDTVKGPFRI